jgi:phosphohistidine phosphatase
MKTVYLLRHAKAIKDHVTPDLERSLTARGEEDISLVAVRLKEKKIMPGLILSSPAIRAKKTAELMAAAIGYPDKVEFEETIYEANPMELLQIVQALPDQLASVMLVGHNPGFTSAVSFFTNTGLDNLPTCGVARIDFSAKSWKLVEEGRGKLAFLEYPGLIKEQKR